MNKLLMTAWEVGSSVEHSRDGMPNIEGNTNAYAYKTNFGMLDIRVYFLSS